MDNHENNGNAKLSGIRQIVRLKEILQKWQSVTLTTTAKAEEEIEEARPGGIPPAVSRRLTEAAVIGWESDEESCCASPEPPADVPRGYLAVYVGPELRRFIIPTCYLGHSLFKVLLEKAEEEFGFRHGGGLTIPCEIETFKYLLNCIEAHYHQHHNSKPILTDNDNASAGSSFIED